MCTPSKSSRMESTFGRTVWGLVLMSMHNRTRRQTTTRNAKQIQRTGDCANMNGRRSWRRSWAASAAWALVVIAFAGVAAYKRAYPRSLSFLPVDRMTRMGVENGNVGRSIASGHGFASPFGVATGPTSWTPPMMPLIYSGCIAVSSKIGGEAWTIAAYTATMCYILAGVLLILRYDAPVLALTVLTIASASHFHALFQTQDDHHLCALLTSICYARYIPYSRNPEHTAHKAIWLGVATGLLSLLNPSIAAAFTIVALFTRHVGVLAKLWVLAAILLVSCPHIVWRRISVGNWYPIKSNSGYELYQAQVLDGDGVLDDKTFLLHPVQEGSEMSMLYKTLGEASFVETTKMRAIDSIFERPIDYAWRCWNRLTVATFAYRPFPDALIEQPSYWFGWIWRQAFVASITLCVLGYFLSSQPTNASTSFALVCLSMLPYIFISYFERYSIACLMLQITVVLDALCLRSQKIGTEETQTDS